MNCIIIEDQPPAQRILKKYIEDAQTLQLLGTFADALQAIDFLKVTAVDLIFLDIHLPKLSGIDFLKTLHNPPAIILTTAFPDFALQSYDFNVSDYLLKPFSFPRFIKAISKVTAQNEASPNTNTVSEHIFIKSGHEHHKVLMDEIIFINSDKDYTEVVLLDRKILSTESLKYWQEEFQESPFVRVHKSYLINTDKITKVRTMHVDLIGDHTIPIGRAYKETFIKKIGV